MLLLLPLLVLPLLAELLKLAAAAAAALLVLPLPAAAAACGGGGGGGCSAAAAAALSSVDMDESIGSPRIWAGSGSAWRWPAEGSCKITRLSARVCAAMHAGHVASR